MIQLKQHRVSKKAVYIGKINDDIRHLRDCLKSGSEEGMSLNLEMYSDRFVLESHLRQGRYDVVLVHLTNDFASNTNLLEMIELHASSSSVIGIAGHNPSLYASLILSGRIHDIVDLKQDHAEILQIMIACMERQKVGILRQEEKDVASPVSSQWGGKTMARVAGRIPNIVHSAIGCVHIHGESGTGKEVVAQMFREAIGDVPFVAISCATIPESLLEATLFGSVKGAFTGATRDVKGLFEEANGGWIFLDEVGCLSRGAQAALLRAIENQEITPVGENRSKKLKFRVISATNACLKEMTQKGDFRTDLYNRLAEVEIYLPPLRERSDELPELIQFLVGALPEGPYRISAAAKRLLESHPWSDGNVRQLRNCLRAMTEFHVDGTLTPQGIPRKVLEEACNYARGNLSPGGFNSKKNEPSQIVPENQSDCSGEELWVRVAFSQSDEVDFDRMSLELFAEVARAITIRNGRFSARDLAISLKISRSTISRRIHEAIEQGIGDFEGLMAKYSH